VCYSQFVLIDSDIVPECVVRPGTLGGLITLYESNFIKFASLVRDPARKSAEFVSQSVRDCPLHLRIEEGSRYTRICRLTYLFDEPTGAVAAPDMAVRIFLDARLAEVVSWAESPRHPHLVALSARYATELDRRWARNIVLSKWLDYLLDMGHSLPAVATA
jgi:uncharacterized protein